MSVNLKRTIARTTSVALIALAAAPVYMRTVRAQGALADITASVFEDRNQNGTRDSGEPAMSGVIVTATGASGTTIATTNASGIAVFSGLAAGTYRVEFVAPSGTFSGPVSATTGSSVQFVAAGGSVTASFASPSDYCQSDPTLAIVCFAQDFATGAGSLPALKTVPYSSNSVPTVNVATRLTMSEVGATWGLAYHRASTNIYQSAFFKRGVSVGSGGLGAIYKTPTASGSPTVLATIPDVGTDPRTPPLASDYWQRDVNGFAMVHKIGIGDIDLSADQNTLYAVNLANNGVYSVAINTDGTSGGVSGPMTVAAPAGCLANQFHVFGLGVSKTRGFVGGVCAGPLSTDLKGYVFEFVASGTASGLSASPTLTFPMNYTKGKVLVSCAVPPNDSGNFLPWDAVSSDTDPDVQKCLTQANQWAPQASISDLEVTDSGDLVIGVRDRFGDQMGYGLLSLDTSSSVITEGNSGGDLLLACNTAGTWVLESGGLCGGRTGAGPGNNQGPGGGEFYAGEFFDPHHQETALGSLVRVPGKGEIVASAYDISTVYQQGTRRFSDANGAGSGGAEITPTHSPSSGFFGKANGLGDMEALCDQAPIEIGNRIWRDNDRNGIQDADEIGIDGVVVELWKNGAKVAETVTANGGQYKFSSLTIAELGPQMDYEIRIPNVSGPSQQTGLNKLSLTQTNAASNGQDLSDSDAVANGTTAVIAVPASSIRSGGQNNHTFDAGFAPVFALGNRVWLDNGAGGGTANDGKINGTEPGIVGVTLKLYAADAGGVCSGSVLATVVTDANGYYRFDNLPQGSYVVVVDVSASSGINSLFSSTGSADPETGVDSDDSGLDTVVAAGAPCAGGIAARKVVLGPTGNEPLSEADRSTVPDLVEDAFSNLTVDFGFVSPPQLAPTTVPGAATTNPAPNPNPTVGQPTVAPTSAAPTTVATASTNAGSTTSLVTTTATSTPTVAPPSTIQTVDAAPPFVDVEGDIALTGANDDQLLLLSLLLIGMGVVLWRIGGEQPSTNTRRASRR